MKVITNYTVVEDDRRGRQIGFRNLWNSSGEHLIEVRINGGDIATIDIADFKKLLLAGEKIAELLAVEEKTRENEATA